MEERVIHRQAALPAHDQTAVVVEPGKGPLHLPAPTITTELSPVLSRRLWAISPLRADPLDDPPGPPGPPGPPRVAVVGPIRHQARGIFPRPAPTRSRDGDRLDRRLPERDFRRGRRVPGDSESNTWAVDHHHPLRAFPPLGLADPRTPFFAGAKLPPAKLSAPSHCFRSSRVPTKARHTSSQTSFSSQSLSRRQQVEVRGYSGGRSLHRAPVLSTPKMPSRTARWSFHRRPPFRLWGNAGNCGAIFSHGASVNRGLLRAIRTSGWPNKIPNISIPRRRL